LSALLLPLLVLLSLPLRMQIGTVELDPIIKEFRRLLERAGVGVGEQGKIDECEIELRHKSFSSDYRRQGFQGVHANHYVPIEDAVMLLGKHLLKQHERNQEMVEKLFEAFDTDRSNTLELEEFKKVQYWFSQPSFTLANIVLHYIHR
jgi:hypothetical protein